MNKLTHMPPKGILFDMDGVLLLTMQRSEQSWQHVCQQFAPELRLPIDVLVEALHESRTAYYQSIAHDPDKQRRDRLQPFETRQEMVEHALEQVGRRNNTLAANMVHAYEALRDEHRHLAPYARETLQMLRAQRLSLALISNGNATYQRQKIKQHQLMPFFDVILIEEECGIAKPDQRIFLFALERLHLTPGEVWMIGDDLERDIAGAQRLAIFAIWFDPFKKGLPEGTTIHPNRIIHSLLDLLPSDHQLA
jgi:putative hydrolase of the HAD superfamily